MIKLLWPSYNTLGTIGLPSKWQMVIVLLVSALLAWVSLQYFFMDQVPFTGQSTVKKTPRWLNDTLGIILTVLGLIGVIGNGIGLVQAVFDL